MKVFEFSHRLIGSYAQFSRSFSIIRSSDLKSEIDHQYDAGRFWPDALLSLNPRYLQGPTVDDLVASGDLDPKYRAEMPTLDVGAPLEWTKDEAKATYFEGGKTPYRCVTKTNLDVQADKTFFATSSTCKP